MNPIWRRSWHELPEDLMVKSHEVAEAFLGARWVRYGGEPEDTSDGIIEAIIIHPHEFEFYGLATDKPTDRYIWDDGKYPRNVRHRFRVPQELFADTFEQLEAVRYKDNPRTRDFFPAINSDDAAVIEKAIDRKGLSTAYVEAMVDLLQDDTPFRSLLYATPEQRLRAAHAIAKNQGLIKS